MRMIFKMKTVSVQKPKDVKTELTETLTRDMLHENMTCVGIRTKHENGVRTYDQSKRETVGGC